MAASGKDLLQDSREALMGQFSAAEQVMEPGNGRDPGVFVNPVQRCCNPEFSVHGHHLGPEERDKQGPRGTLSRTEPLKASVIGAFVRGLSMRDVESLCEKAGLGKLSKLTVQRICSELRERFEAFKRRDLYEIHLAALFVDAVATQAWTAGARQAPVCPVLHRDREQTRPSRRCHREP